MKVLALTGAALLLAAAPVGATWTLDGHAPATARAAVLQPVGAPVVRSSCLSDGRLGVTVSWAHTDVHVTGYDVYRSTNDAAPVRVAQVGATTTETTDPATAFDLASTFDYTVVSVTGGWTATSTETRLSDNRVCTGATPVAPAPPATGTTTTL